MCSRINYIANHVDDIGKGDKHTKYSEGISADMEKTPEKFFFNNLWVN